MNQNIYRQRDVRYSARASPTNLVTLRQLYPLFFILSRDELKEDFLEYSIRKRKY